MRIIITGAIGHIGSYLIRDLANNFPNSEIVMIDNMMTQRYPSLFNLPSTCSYRFIEVDVNKVDLNSIFKDADVAVHLAAITDAAGSFDKADLVEENNYQATLNVAEACEKNNVRLIALSSTSVYGSQRELVSEDCLLEELKPQSPYAVTKLREEQLINDLFHQGKLKAISCRFGTIYGASIGMRFHTAVNKFCWQAVMGQAITVWKTAYDQKRPYLDLIDASRAISFIIKNDIFDGRVYNVLSQNLTVRQVVETIREFIPNIEVTFVDNKIMNQLSYEVSCKRFKAKGFSFEGNLKRGVEETIQLLKQSNQ